MSTDAIRRILAALPKPKDRDAAINAHQLAALFHTAMGTMCAMSHEIEDAEKALRENPDSDIHRSLRNKAQDIYDTALSEAASALGKMPAVWAEAMTSVLIAQNGARS